MKREQQIVQLLDDERKEGYKDGIAEGSAVAQRIFVWWMSNDQLATPHSKETIQEWCKKELDALHAKLKVST